MTTVLLIRGYYVEIDDYNHTLKQKFIGQTEDGETKESYRLIGYYPNMPRCVEKVARLCALEDTDGEILSVAEYARAAESAFMLCREIRLGADT